MVKLLKEDIDNALKNSTTIGEFFNSIGRNIHYHTRDIMKLNELYDVDIRKQVKENKKLLEKKHYICKNCGKEFTEKYSKWSDGNFCCKECARTVSYKNFQKTKMSKCIICGKDVEVNCYISDKFVKCKKCKEQEYKKLCERKNKEYKLRQINKLLNSNNFCLCCNKEIPSDKKFCNNKCHKDYIHKQKMKEVMENNGIGCDFRQIKRYIIETRGHKCEICGNTEWMDKPIPLVLDHINGRASDDRLENLRLVCGNCDMQLPTYKSKNKNSDRKRCGKYI